MYKNATKCNETIGKWCKTKHGASKIIDTFETYHLLAKATDESAHCCHAAYESMYVLQFIRSGYLEDSLDLL
jgi:hypothetical protein